MTVFGDYAEYYNLIYADKNYKDEADFVINALKQNCNPKTILDLGCGSGSHAFCFSENGHHVVGIDRSEEMLALAAAKRSQLDEDAKARLEFYLGDISTVRLGRRFAAVTALFHVMSYLPTNDDFWAALETVNAHLEPDGIFLFDFWYGPAVLHQRPLARVKQIKRDGFELWRFANPQLNTEHNQVLVTYNIVIRNHHTGHSRHFEEKHLMRYYFKPEIDLLLSTHGLEVVKFCEYLSGENPSEETWNGLVVARRRGYTGST